MKTSVQILIPTKLIFFPCVLIILAAALWLAVAHLSQSFSSSLNSLNLPAAANVMSLSKVFVKQRIFSLP